MIRYEDLHLNSDKWSRSLSSEDQSVHSSRGYQIHGACTGKSFRHPPLLRQLYRNVNGMPTIWGETLNNCYFAMRFIYAGAGRKVKAVPSNMTLQLI